MGHVILRGGGVGPVGNGADPASSEGKVRRVPHFLQEPGKMTLLARPRLRGGGAKSGRGGGATAAVVVVAGSRAGDGRAVPRNENVLRIKLWKGEEIEDFEWCECLSNRYK